MPALSWFYHFHMVAVYVSSCINPFIYAAKYADFQDGVKRMVARVTGRPQQAHGSQQNATSAQVISNPAYQCSTAITDVT